MFDKLLELIGEFWETVKFFQIIMPYEKGVRIRKGVLHAVLGPGLHGKLPILDEFMVDTVVQTTEFLANQTFTTKDNHAIYIRGIVVKKVSNIVKWLVESEDQEGIVKDVCYAAIAEVALNNTWDYIRTEAFQQEITIKARKRARKYGLKIIELRPAELVKLRAYRFVTGF